MHAQRPTPQPRNLRRILAVGTLVALAIAAATLALPTRPTLATPEPTDRNIMLVLTGDITWEDAATHPESRIAQLAPHAQTANLLPQALATACPYNAWFLLSAGRPSDTLGTQETGCFDIPLTPGSELPNAAAYREAMEKWNDRATPGTFASALADAGIDTQAIGTGAGIMLADTELRVPARYEPAPSDDTELAALTSASAREHKLTVVDADRRTRPLGDAPETENTEANLARLDAIANAAPAGTRLLVAAANPGPRSEEWPQPSLLFCIDIPAPDGSPAPGTLAPAILSSSDVRQTGFAQLTSIPPTILRWLDLPIPAEMNGGTLNADTSACPGSKNCANATGQLLSNARHADLAARYYGLFGKTYISVLLACLAAATIALAAPFGPRIARSTPASAAFQWGLLALSCVPFGALVANRLGWWNSPRPWFTVLAEISMLAAALAAIALALGAFCKAEARTVAPMLVATGATAAAYLADVAFGSHTIANSFFGFLLVIRGRFYGTNNEAFPAIFVGTLLALAFLGVRLRGPDSDAGIPEHRWRAAGCVGGIGLAVLAIEGAPGLGTDFGGVLALLPALALLVLLVGRFRMSVAKSIAVGTATLGVIAAASLADWMRPAGSRTHLGGFVQQIIDGTAWQYAIMPKLRANLHLLTHDRWGRFAFAALAFCILVLGPALAARGRETRLAATADASVRRRRSPWAWPVQDAGAPGSGLLRRSASLRIGLVAIAVACLIGSALNDSGIIITGIALAVLTPSLAATMLRDHAEHAPSARVAPHKTHGSAKRNVFRQKRSVSR